VFNSVSEGRLAPFLNTPSDATLLPAVLAAAEEALADGPFSAEAPGDNETRADVESLAIAPLFDGSALERI
jgi:hypothetical protein